MKDRYGIKTVAVFLVLYFFLYTFVMLNRKQ